ncbi:MAG: plasmid partitioning protein RepB [Pelagimonas sp.]|jgi:ParB family chromosome partitioning protein|nr:plasmid partitioning protein RepB [Pelagimonas sp.]
MARKDLLKGLMGETSSPEQPQKSQGLDPAKPRRTSGAIGAVSQSIAQLKSRSVVELNPDQIMAGGLTDRLDTDDADHAALVQSMREYGQQVPILVRPHPDKADHYQIVYGRRRLLALQDLGSPVKALVRDLDDRALVMAQGQENSARRDLTFIEKCNFAHQMREAGYDRKAICDALSIDKTLISRMLSVFDRIGIEVIEAIGSAPGIGRDRWIALADQMEKINVIPEQIVAAITIAADDKPSPERFEMALRACGDRSEKLSTKTSAAPRGKTRKITSANGFQIGKAVTKDKEVVLSLPRTGQGKFADWLVDNLEEIYGDWISDTTERADTNKGGKKAGS